jgi:hypothetical protein
MGKTKKQRTRFQDRSSEAESGRQRPGTGGLGSYIVNAQGDCNGCHTNPEFADGGNPYFKGQMKNIDPKTYLGGGVDFGPFGPTSPDIVSRNLTPDKTGRPEGGTRFQSFVGS